MQPSLPGLAKPKVYSKRQLILAGIAHMVDQGKATKVFNRSEVSQYWSWTLQLPKRDGSTFERTVHVGSTNGFRIGRIVSDSHSGQGGIVEAYLIGLGMSALESGAVKVEDLPSNRRRAGGLHSAGHTIRG